MDIKTFSSTIRHLPANVSVLIRGPHGIGKSHLASVLLIGTLVLAVNR